LKRNIDLQFLSETTFDVVIIGGGITGAGVMRDAARRGLRTLLLEKGDFASGTSSKSGKLIHGGLRYLRYGHLKLVFESCQERVLLMRNVAPHIITPVRFFLPFYPFSKTPLWLAAIGLFVYDLLSSFKNIGHFKIFSLKNIKSIAPFLQRQELKGVLAYYDGFCPDFRLVIDSLKDGQASGGLALNYMEVKSIIKSKSGFEIEVFDSIQNKNLLIRSLTVVNAAGAWADKILDLSFEKRRFGLKLTEGIHLLLSNSKLQLKGTIALEAPQDGRNLYFIPWGEKVLVGTTDRYNASDADHLQVSKEQVDYLLQAVEKYFPAANITQKDIEAVTIGVRPLIGSDQGVKEEKISRDHQLMLSKEGMISLCGGKLTTYRKMAEQAVDILVKNFFFARKIERANTHLPISGGDLASLDLESIKAQHSQNHKAIDILYRRYGSNLLKVLALAKEDSEISSPVDALLSISEIRYMIREEWAFHLEDILMRRSDIYYLAKENGFPHLEFYSKIMQQELAWDEPTRINECHDYKVKVENLLFAWRK